MSNAAMSWAWKQDVPHQGTAFVLIVLADYADEEGSCFPSQEHIADKTKQSVRAVRNAIVRLEEMGLVERRREAVPGNPRGLRYFLQMPASAKRFSTFHGPAPEEAKPAPGAGVTAERGAGVDAKPEQGAGVKPARGAGVEFKPAPHDSQTGTSRHPSKEESVRESNTHTARARDPRLDQILERHPWSDRWDVWEVEDGWAALSEADRAAAAVAFERWLDRQDEKRVAKGTIAGPARYLAQRLWTLLPDETPAADQHDWIMVERFSLPWWFLLWRSIETGDLRAAKLIIQLAEGGTSTTASGEAKAAIDSGADADLVRLSVADERDSIEAWRKHLFDAHRLRMPVPDVAPYIWAPAKHPDELQRSAADELADYT